jgi:hypothetical protein
LEFVKPVTPLVGADKFGGFTRYGTVPFESIVGVDVAVGGFVVVGGIGGVGVDVGVGGFVVVGGVGVVNFADAVGVCVLSFLGVAGESMCEAVKTLIPLLEGV